MTEDGDRRPKTEDRRPKIAERKTQKHKTPTEVLKQERKNNNIFSLQKKFFIMKFLLTSKKNLIDVYFNFRQASV